MFTNLPGFSMSSFSVCARFRPLKNDEGKCGTKLCFRRIDDENVALQDEEEGHLIFNLDRVYYGGTLQSDVFNFTALPILNDAVNGRKGTIITYGQTGTGKTYTMEGPGVLDDNEEEKGLLTRVVEWLVAIMKSSSGVNACSINFSMVEIYKEKIRDLFDLSTDNLEIKESDSQGILLDGVTEISLHDVAGALRSISLGIGNKADNSSCVYIFNVQNNDQSGKIVLVDLAATDKFEKNGAGLTRLLLAPGAIILCCSPLSEDASKTMATLQSGARSCWIDDSPLLKKGVKGRARAIKARANWNFAAPFSQRRWKKFQASKLQIKEDPRIHMRIQGRKTAFLDFD